MQQLLQSRTTSLYPTHQDTHHHRLGGGLGAAGAGGATGPDGGLGGAGDGGGGGPGAGGPAAGGAIGGGAGPDGVCRIFMVAEIPPPPPPLSSFSRRAFTSLSSFSSALLSFL